MVLKISALNPLDYGDNFAPLEAVGVGRSPPVSFSPQRQTHKHLMKESKDYYNGVTLAPFLCANVLPALSSRLRQFA